MKLPKLDTFLKKLHRSWEIAKISIEKVKEAMKKQFNKKRQNSQGLKQGDNIWLEAMNIQSKQPSKKLDQKRYRLFKSYKRYWTRSISAKITRKIGNTQHV